MTLPARSFPVLLFAALLAAVRVFADARSGKQARALAATGPARGRPAEGRHKDFRRTHAA